MYYEKVFKTFKNFKVRYLVGGGLAVNLHGVPRFTKDIDILIDVSPLNLVRLEKALKKLGYRPRPPVPIREFLNPVNWKKRKQEKGLVALSLYHPKFPFQEIDLLVNIPLKFDSAISNAISVRSGNAVIWVVGINDLLKMKTSAGRAQDKSDIESLKKIKRLEGGK